MTGADTTAAPADPEDTRLYLRQVMAEIDAEVRRRRPDLPVSEERELDKLFLEHSPVGTRHGAIADALRMVDTAVFIDPVVPVASQRPAGAYVKRGLRSLNLWYIGYVTHQVSVFAAAAARTLHLVDQQLQELARRVPADVAVPVVAEGDASSWWVPIAAGALAGTPGRVLHAACGDGWLVRRLTEEGVDAYGVDPRPHVTLPAALAGTDLREEAVADHLRAVGPGTLGAVVLSGVVDGMAPAQRDELLALLAERLGPAGVLVLHSLTPAAWAAPDAPVEADLAPGRPLRAAAWVHLLEGWTVEQHDGPDGTDYLLVARR